MYRDLVQAKVMVDDDYLWLATSNTYRYNSDGK